jgi:hypothetical protein
LNPIQISAGGGGATPAAAAAAAAEEKARILSCNRYYLIDLN